MAIIGIIIGGIIAAGSSYLATKVQIDGQAAQASADFIRQQEQEAYSQLLTTEDPMVQSLVTCADAIRGYQANPSSLTIPLATSVISALDPAYANFRKAIANVMLVGSQQVRDIVDLLAQRVGGMNFFCDVEVRPFTTSLGRTENRPAADNDVNENLDKVLNEESEIIKNFIEAARKDLRR